jgi:hypothetical protein
VSCPRKRASSTHRRCGGHCSDNGPGITGFRLSLRCARSAGMTENLTACGAPSGGQLEILERCARRKLCQLPSAARWDAGKSVYPGPWSDGSTYNIRLRSPWTGSRRAARAPARVQVEERWKRGGDRPFAVASRLYVEIPRRSGRNVVAECFLAKCRCARSGRH